VTIYGLNEHRFTLIARQGYFSDPMYIRGSFSKVKQPEDKAEQPNVHLEMRLL